MTEASTRGSLTAVPRGWTIVAVASGMFLALSPAITARYALASTSQEKIELIQKAISAGNAVRVNNTEPNVEVAGPNDGSPPNERTWSAKSSWSGKS
jgi:hypothetical protein